MPGLTLVHRTEAPVDAGSVRASLTATLSTDVSPDLSHELLYKTQHTVLAVSHYRGYPWRWIETERFQIALEGHVYDLASPVAESLVGVADRILGASSIPHAAASWLPTVDGDFVLWTRAKDSGRMVLLNDMLGRLPLYTLAGPSQSGETVVSRSVQMVAHWTETHRPDRQAIAETLLFGYPLSTRTLFEGIQRLDPATAVLPRTHAVASVSDPLRQTRPFRHRSLDANAHLLANRFRGACERRADAASAPVLGLSGGLDSRAVLAGLHQSSGADSLRATTFVRPDGSDAEDAAYAESLADLFGVPWSSFPIASPSADSQRTLLHLKGGLNSLEYSFMVDVLRSVRSRFGSEATLFTGDGGDKMVPDLRPAPSLPDAPSFLDHLLRRQGQMPLKTVTAVVGLEQDDLADALLSHVTAYTTSTWEDRYAEFLLRERALSGFVEGEDRNRHFLWHIAPFYAWPVVSLSLKIPPKQKSYDRLYSAFLRVLTPETHSVPRSNHASARPGSLLYQLVVRTRHVVHQFPRLHNSLRALLRNQEPTDIDPDLASRIRVKANRVPAIGTYLSASALNKVLADELPATRGGIYSLLTLASFLETYIQG